MKHLKKYNELNSHRYTIVKFEYFNLYKKTKTTEYCLIDKSKIVKDIPKDSLIYSYDEKSVAFSGGEKNNGYEYLVIAATNNRDYSYSLPKLDKIEIEKIIGDRNEVELDSNHPIILNIINK